MGRINDAMKDYLSDRGRFAVLFNACCFHGERVVKAVDLAEGSESYREKIHPDEKREALAASPRDGLRAGASAASAI